MFNRLLVAVSATALFLTLPGAALASEPPAANQSLEATAAGVQSWLSDAAAWSAGYTALIDLRASRLGSLLEGGTHLRTLLDTGKRREARTWAESWAREQRAGFASEYDAFTRLPSEPPPLDAAIASDPHMRQASQRLIELRDRVGTLLRQTSTSGETYVDHVVAASSGRAGALVALDGGLFSVLLAHLSAENLMLEATQGPIGEPNFYYSAAMIEANRVAMAWMTHNQAMVLGRPSDRAGTASTMRTHVAASREAAADLVEATRHMRSLIDNEPGLRETPLYATLVTAFDSLLISAGIERELADQNFALAAATEGADTEAQQRIALKIETLVNARIAEFGRRQSLLAGTS